MCVIPISSQPDVVLLCRPMIIQNINSAIDQIVKGFEFETSNQYIYWSNYNFNFVLIFPKFLVLIFIAV